MMHPESRRFFNRRRGGGGRGTDPRNRKHWIHPMTRLRIVQDNTPRADNLQIDSWIRAGVIRNFEGKHGYLGMFDVEIELTKSLGKKLKGILLLRRRKNEDSHQVDIGYEIQIPIRNLGSRDNYFLDQITHNQKSLRLENGIEYEDVLTLVGVERKTDTYNAGFSAENSIESLQIYLADRGQVEAGNLSFPRVRAQQAIHAAVGFKNMLGWTVSPGKK